MLTGKWIVYMLVNTPSGAPECIICDVSLGPQLFFGHQTPSPRRPHHGWWGCSVCTAAYLLADCFWNGFQPLVTRCNGPDPTLLGRSSECTLMSLFLQWAVWRLHLTTGDDVWASHHTFPESGRKHLVIQPARCPVHGLFPLHPCPRCLKPHFWEQLLKPRGILTRCPNPHSFSCYSEFIIIGGGLPRLSAFFTTAEQFRLHYCRHCFDNQHYLETNLESANWVYLF